MDILDKIYRERMPFDLDVPLISTLVKIRLHGDSDGPVYNFHVVWHQRLPLPLPGKKITVETRLYAARANGSGESNTELIPTTGRSKLLYWPMMIAVYAFLIFQWIVFQLPLFVGRLIVTGFAGVLGPALRAVPAVLATIVILFVTADAWHMLARPFDDRLWALVALFVAVSGLAALSSLTQQRGLDILKRNLREDTPTVRSANPAHLLSATFGCRPDPELMKDADECRFNRLIITAGIAQVLAIGVCVALSLAIVGVIAIDPAQARSLLDNHAPHTLVTLPGHLLVTRELVAISLGLGAFATLYYAGVGLQADEERKHLVETGARSLHKHAQTILLLQVGSRGRRPVSRASLSPFGGRCSAPRRWGQRWHPRAVPTNCVRGSGAGLQLIATRLTGFGFCL